MSILSSAEYGILRLTINRPARRNTISSDMFRSLAASLEAAAVDPKIRVVLLRGSADIFSAGADFEESLKAPENLDAAMAECFCALRKFPKPVIAQVTGLCGQPCTIQPACRRTCTLTTFWFGLYYDARGRLPSRS